MGTFIHSDSHKRHTPTHSARQTHQKTYLELKRVTNRETDEGGLNEGDKQRGVSVVKPERRGVIFV